ncbi:MAG: GNAT family N-acetyltransferase [Actinobacteria bacterium]|nr:GNAT family N-acetyltransferase [Actinomycetota bacterium]
MVEEMRVLYDGLDLDAADMPKAGPAELGPPDGVFLVGYDGDEAVGCGGVKRFSDGIGEIKRMYVVPDRRGSGVAQTLLAALEDEARRLGYGTLRLDTGDRQPGARRLYERAGFREIDNYNGNPAAAYFGEKHLPPAP